MPQATTTVTPCAKSVEELRVVEISFYDHEVYAVGKLIASIRHDDDLTQPWLVLINGVEVFRHDTFKRCHSFITWHYKENTLPEPQTAENVYLDGEFLGILFKVRNADEIWENDPKTYYWRCGDGVQYWSVREAVEALRRVTTPVEVPLFSRELVAA